MLCTKKILNVRNNFCAQHVLPKFELGIFMYWTCNSMNNLSSYCGLVDAKIRTSDKDLPVTSTACTSEQKWRPNSVPSFTLTLVTCNLGLLRKHIIYSSFCVCSWVPNFWRIDNRTSKSSSRICPLKYWLTDLSGRHNVLTKSARAQSNVSSVVEFQRWWVLKSKLFAQEVTCSKEILISTKVAIL